MTNELSAADQYRASMKSREEVIVDVHLPSGNIFKFAEFPSVHKNAFELGKLPQYASNGAAQKWTEQGVLPEAKAKEEAAENEATVREMWRIRNIILEHSREPKLVVGDAGPGELSTEELANEDAAYLFELAQAGGDEAIRLQMFPKGPKSSVVAGPNRKARRAAAKQSG